MPVVNIPDVGSVNFPDSMSQDDIKAAVTKLYESRPKIAAPGTNAPSAPPAGGAPTAEAKPGTAGSIAQNALAWTDYFMQPWYFTRKNPLGPAGGLLKAGGIAVNYLSDVAENVYEQVAGSWGLKTGAIDRELARQIPMLGAGKAVSLASKAATPLQVGASFSAPIAASTFEATGGDLRQTAQAAAVGLALPAAAGAGVRAGERVAASVAAKLPAAMETGTLMAGRVAGSQAVGNAVALIAQSPDLIKLSKENPEAFKEELIKSVVLNLAFEAVQMPQNMREVAARNYVDAYMQSPEYKAHVDEIAREVATPAPAEPAPPVPPGYEQGPMVAREPRATAIMAEGHPEAPALLAEQEAKAKEAASLATEPIPIQEKPFEALRAEEPVAPPVEVAPKPPGAAAVPEAPPAAEAAPPKTPPPPEGSAPEAFTDEMSGAELAPQRAPAPAGAAAAATAIGIRPLNLLYTPVQVAAGAGNLARKGINFYSEWLTDRIARVGGPAGQQLSDDAKRITTLAKKFYGELTPILDPAKQEAGKLGRATTWLAKLNNVTDDTAIANVVDAIESPSRPVPQWARAVVQSARTANLEIGRMAQSASPGFIASGKFQRNWTALGMEIVGQGKGHPAFEALVRGLARANNMPEARMRDYLLKMKEAMDAPGGDAAAMRKINQDFSRDIPKFITHIKIAGAWQEIIHTHLPQYLEQSAQKAATALAFRNVYRTPQAIAQLRQMVSGPGMLPTRYHPDFDALVRALQGLHSDFMLTRKISANLNPALMALGTANKVVGEIGGKLALTGTFVTNIPETILGATPQFLGYRNYWEGVRRSGELYPEMERAGILNRSMYDWSFDPSNPIRSASRIAGNAISASTFQLALNEFQERVAASTARVVAERITAGQLSKWEKSMLPRTFKAMGFTDAQSAQIMAGHTDLLAQFQSRAAAFLTGGNVALAERSRLGSSALFNTVFRFQSYPMTKTNQLGHVMGDFFDAVGDFYKGKPNAGKNLWNQSRLTSRFLFGTSMQGATTMALLALAYGGPGEVEARYNEAKSNLFGFALDTMVSAIGGPIYLMSRGIEEGGLHGVKNALVSSMFPVTMTTEIMDMVKGVGAYKNLDEVDRIHMFLKKRVPGSRMVDTGLAIAGLSSEDPHMEAALRGFYRWSRKNIGVDERNLRLKEKDPAQDLKIAMKKVTKEMKAGRDFGDALAEAFGVAGELGKSPKSVAASLRNRTVLKGPENRKLTDEELADLEKTIGSRLFQKLEAYDAMLKAVASALSGSL